MNWTILTLLMIIILISYIKKKQSAKLSNDKVVTLSMDQAILVKDLIRKELETTEEDRQEIIEKSAAAGETINLDSLFSISPDLSKLEQQEVESMKKALRQKYGKNIPVDSAYRIMKQLNPNEEPVWSDNPGCFESYLQRREGNILFLPERRLVTKKEINEAQLRDKLDQERFEGKVDSFLKRFVKIDKELSPTQAHEIIKEIQNLLEEGAGIGGDIQNKIQLLETTEDNLVVGVSDKLPEIADLLEKERNLSTLARLPYVAMVKRSESPIPENETIPFLLSEDLDTIALVGLLSRGLAPNFKPNETDVQEHLDKAIANGFSKDIAEQIIAAWNKKS